MNPVTIARRLIDRICYPTRSQPTEALVHVDRPTSFLVNNLGQEFIGWFAVPNSVVSQTLEIRIDGAPIETNCYKRPDVEQSMPGWRVIGWAVHLEPDRAFGLRRRTLELNLQLGDQWTHTRHFFKSKNLMPGDSNSPLFFMHIPKTAGTALRQFVDFAFGEFASLMVYGDHPGVDLAQAIGPLGQYALTRELIFGHYDFDFVKQLNYRNPKILTIFRNPQELIRSYLRFNPFPAEQFLDNPLTRHVCGLSYAEPFGLVSQSHLEMALSYVDRHFYVLQSDQLQQFADQVSQVFCLPNFTVPRINETVALASVNETAFRVDTCYDMQLYEACRHRTGSLLGFLNA